MTVTQTKLAELLVFLGSRHAKIQQIEVLPEITKASPTSNRIINHRRRISCEELNERRLAGICVFCEEPETPDHHLKHKKSGILLISCDEDQPRDDTELVPNSIPERLLINKTDLHVKEVKLLPRQSTSINGKISAHQVFDQIPLRVTRKEKYQEDSTMIKASKDIELSFSHKADRVWEPGGLPYKLDLCDWLEEVSKSHRDSHLVETFPSSHRQVVKGDLEDLKLYDRKRDHKTLYSEYAQEDGYRQQEVMKFISSWNIRVWEPGGISSEHDKWKGLDKCSIRGRLRRLLLDGSDFSTTVSDNFDHNKKLPVIVTSVSKSFTGSITIFRIERCLSVVSLLCFMGISFWTTVLWNRKTRKNNITSWWNPEGWLRIYKEFKPLFEQIPKELSPAGIKWLISSYLVHKTESETGFEANDHVSMRLLLCGTTKDVIARLKSDDSDKTWKVKMTGRRLTDVWEELDVANDLDIRDVVVVGCVGELRGIQETVTRVQISLCATYLNKDREENAHLSLQGVSEVLTATKFFYTKEMSKIDDIVETIMGEDKTQFTSGQREVLFHEMPQGSFCKPQVVKLDTMREEEQLAMQEVDDLYCEIKDHVSLVWHHWKYKEILEQHKETHEMTLEPDLQENRQKRQDFQSLIQKHRVSIFRVWDPGGVKTLRSRSFEEGRFDIVL